MKLGDLQLHYRGWGARPIFRVGKGAFWIGNTRVTCIGPLAVMMDNAR